MSWFDTQFGAIVSIPWHSISNFFNEHTKCSSYEDIGKLLKYLPDKWLSVLGTKLYEEYRQFIYDFHLIFKWLDVMETKFPNAPWEFSSLLARRQKDKETIPPLPTAEEIIAYKQELNSRPPSYHSRSNVDITLGTAPQMATQSIHSITRSYHTTAPNQVDEKGMPFTTQNFESKT